MKKEKIKELITAYIDNEIKDQDELRKFQDELANNPGIDFDIKSELATKKLAGKKFIRNNIPYSVKDEIHRKILAERSVTATTTNTFIRSLESGAFIKFSTVLVVLLALILLLFNRPAPVDENGISIQGGNNNMLLQAHNNFEKLISGSMQLQFVSNKPDEIRQFFVSQGVDYNTLIPVSKQIQLAGATITKHNGIKFAHHLYYANDGKFIYIFQVHERFFAGDSIIRLSSDLLDYLNLGGNYKSTQKEYYSVLKKINGKVLAVVTDVPEANLPENIYNLK